MTKLLLDYGLVLLFGVVAAESAGIPLPGETGLIAAAVLASQGHYSIVTVIVVAAGAAIVGDNVGYWLGRVGGRRLLRRIPIVRHHFERALPSAERFFASHGAKAVFLGRFVAVLRVTAAWMAGMSHMAWWRFLIWNALGGVIWASAYGTVAYYAGKAAAEAISHYGLYVLAAVVVLGLIALAIWWRRRRR